MYIHLVSKAYEMKQEKIAGLQILVSDNLFHFSIFKIDSVFPLPSLCLDCLCFNF